MNIKTTFIENAVKYNNETEENKMCISCNHLFSNDKLLKNDQCVKCNKNSQKNVDNYVSKDLFEQKIHSYKEGAKKRFLLFTLTDNECLKLCFKTLEQATDQKKRHSKKISSLNNP
jgi:Zn finger protein HypA/HybF involved in hydrogenase expression